MRGNRRADRVAAPPPQGSGGQAPGARFDRTHPSARGLSSRPRGRRSGRKGASIRLRVSTSESANKPACETRQRRAVQPLVKPRPFFFLILISGWIGKQIYSSSTPRHSSRDTHMHTYNRRGQDPGLCLRPAICPRCDVPGLPGPADTHRMVCTRRAVVCSLPGSGSQTTRGSLALSPPRPVGVLLR